MGRLRPNKWPFCQDKTHKAREETNQAEVFLELTTERTSLELAQGKESSLNQVKFMHLTISSQQAWFASYSEINSFLNS